MAFLLDMPTKQADGFRPLLLVWCKAGPQLDQHPNQRYHMGSWAPLGLLAAHCHSQGIKLPAWPTTQHWPTADVVNVNLCLLCSAERHRNDSYRKQN